LTTHGKKGAEMPELASMREAGTKTVIYELDGGEKVHLEVAHNLITGEDMESLNETPDEEQVTALFNLLSRAIISWDITKDGEALPITVETFRQLPFKFSTTIMEKITNALNPPKRNSGSFGNR
jgi:hypothetical protein